MTSKIKRQLRGYLTQSQLSKTKCSCVECDRISIKQIWIKGESIVMNKKYRMLVNVCQGHYDEEKQAGGILEEYPPDRRKIVQ